MSLIVECDGCLVSFGTSCFFQLNVMGVLYLSFCIFLTRWPFPAPLSHLLQPIATAARPTADTDLRCNRNN